MPPKFKPQFKRLLAIDRALKAGGKVNCRTLLEVKRWVLSWSVSRSDGFSCSNALIILSEGSWISRASMGRYPSSLFLRMRPMAMRQTIWST